MLSARYTGDDAIRLQRAGSGTEFPAWVQGLDFTGIIRTTTPMSGGNPPTLIEPSDGYSIPACCSAGSGMEGSPKSGSTGIIWDFYNRWEKSIQKSVYKPPSGTL